MRLAAMAYRPRSAKTAYGSGIRNIRLPYIYDIPNAHQPAPHVAGGRYGSNHPHLIRYQHQALEPRGPDRGDLQQLRRCTTVDFTIVDPIQASFAESRDTNRTDFHAQPKTKGSSPSRDIAQSDGQAKRHERSTMEHFHVALPLVTLSCEGDYIHPTSTHTKFYARICIHARDRSKGNTLHKTHQCHATSQKPVSGDDNPLQTQPSYKSEYTHPPSMHTPSYDITFASALDLPVEPMCPTSSSTQTIMVLGRTSKSVKTARVDEGRDLLSQHYTLTTSSRAQMGDFHKTTANRFGSTHAHNTSVAKSSIKNHALCTKNRHSMSESEPKTLINFDQVDCCDPLDYFEWENNGAKQKHLNTAMEIAQLDVVAISGDVFGYPGVVPIWLETHPDAVSFRIWSQAQATPRPLGDGLKWSNDHEIYQAPSPTFDCLHELICKHSVLALPHGTTVSKGINGEHGCVNDSSSEAQPSGIEGVYEEDSTMYFEYESGILRFPGARGLCTAALNVYASNAESPQCGTTYLQRTIEWVHATTMGIESEIAMAGCLVSTTVDFAKATTYKTLKGITVPVDKQQLITALFKTNKTKSSLITLGIFYGLMDLFSDEIQAMPPPPKGDSKPARSRRGSTAATDDDEVESLIADFTPVGDVDRPVQQEDIEPISPLPGTIEGERKKNEELEARLRSLESKLTQPPSSEGSVTTEIQRQIQLALEVQAKTLRYEADEQMRRHNEQLENKMKSMEAQKEAEILVAVQDAKDAFNVIAENQASKAEELENNGSFTHQVYCDK